MKNQILPLFVVAILGCSKPQLVEQLSAAPELDKQFQVRVGQSVEIGELQFTFDSVPEDSRCPKSVLCIWTGNAVVILKFSDGEQRLNSTDGSRTTSHGSYSIELIQIDPYPETPGTIPTEEYIATLKVTSVVR